MSWVLDLIGLEEPVQIYIHKLTVQLLLLASSASLKSKIPCWLHTSMLWMDITVLSCKLCVQYIFALALSWRYLQGQSGSSSGT